jgi:hypothetical protein
MTTEMQPIEISKEKRQKADAITGGIILIGVSVLLFSGWWWPGIMFVVGLGVGTGMIFRGKTAKGFGLMALLWSIPIGIWILQEMDLSLNLVAPIILAVVGVIVLAKAFLFRDKTV